MSDDAVETVAFLQAEAARHGYQVESWHLKRWYAAGLLPRFPDRRRQMGTGRSHGSKAIHPAGTPPQLLRLLELRAEPSRFTVAAARWQLWWEGWEVDLTCIRTDLAAELAIWEAAFNQLGTAKERQEGLLSDEGLDLIERFQAADLPPHLRRVRKRASADALPTLMQLTLSVMGGTFREELAGSSDANGWQDADDAATIWRGVGLGRVRATLPPALRATLDREIAATLSRFSQAVAPASLAEALGKASDVDLAAARDELKRMGAFARALLPVLQPLIGGHTAGHDLLTLPVKEARALMPGALLAWLALRRRPAYYTLFTTLTEMPQLATVLAQLMASGTTSTGTTPRREIKEHTTDGHPDCRGESKTIATTHD